MIASGMGGVAVTGIGVLSPLGDRVDELHAALCAGRSGLARDPSLAVEGLAFGAVGALDPESPERHLDPSRNLRPLDRPSRLAAAAAGLALADAGRATNGEEQMIGLVLGTMFGSVRTISEFDRRGLTAGPAYVKPLDFANSVINAAAGQAAIWHRLAGLNATLAGGPTAGLQALVYAADQVGSGRAEAVLAGGADELCVESLVGFLRAGMAAGCNGMPGEHPVPFDAARNGFAPAEGAALLLLESEESATRRGARVLGRILGTGTGQDTSRGRDPRRTADILSRAIHCALREAEIAPEDLVAVSASANGSRSGDLAEALGLSDGLSGGGPVDIPVTAIKGAVGESLGAAAALQTAVLLRSLATGELPGIHRLDRLDPGLPLAAVGAESRALRDGPGLVTAVGFDGNVVALIVVAERSVG